MKESNNKEQAMKEQNPNVKVTTKEDMVWIMNEALKDSPQYTSDDYTIEKNKDYFIVRLKFKHPHF